MPRIIDQRELFKHAILSSSFLVFFMLILRVQASTDEFRAMSPFKKYQKMVIAEQEIRWPKADSPVSNEPINRVDCYQELTREFVNYTMALPNDFQLAYRPCMIRIPTQHRIRFLHLNLTDRRSNVKIVAGTVIEHAPLKTVGLTNKSGIEKYGPYYVPCQWAYLIFESYTRATRESVYFRIEEIPNDVDLDMIEMVMADGCSKHTRNYAARHFHRPITAKPSDSIVDVDQRYSPGRYLDMDG